MNRWICAALATVLIAAVTVSAESAARRRLPQGDYGGEHASLRVFGKGAEIDLECAHGFVTRTIRIDHDGTFDVTGSLSIERGPARLPERPVRVTGTVAGDRIEFTVRDEPFEPGGNVYGPFTVTLGAASSYARCM